MIRYLGSYVVVENSWPWIALTPALPGNVADRKVLGFRAANPNGVFVVRQALVSDLLPAASSLTQQEGR